MYPCQDSSTRTQNKIYRYTWQKISDCDTPRKTTKLNTFHHKRQQTL